MSFVAATITKNESPLCIRRTTDGSTGLQRGGAGQVRLRRQCSDEQQLIRRILGLMQQDKTSANT